MSEETSSNQHQRASRFVPLVIFFLISAMLFIGGMTAILYLTFSKYSGVQNIWLLFCGAPVVLVGVVLGTIYTLYRRFGKPLQSLFHAINTVEEGDLSVRVPEDNTTMYNELFKRFNNMVGELERAEQQRR